MDAETKAQIQAHARALAALLYEETDPERVLEIDMIGSGISAPRLALRLKDGRF
jgi:hypothetical protein